MTGPELLILLMKFGPIGLELAEELTTIWNKDMTPEEVSAYCKGKRKSLADYIEAEKASRITTTT